MAVCHRIWGTLGHLGLPGEASEAGHPSWKHRRWPGRYCSDRADLSHWVAYAEAALVGAVVAGAADGTGAAVPPADGHGALRCMSVT